MQFVFFENTNGVAVWGKNDNRSAADPSLKEHLARLGIEDRNLRKDEGITVVEVSDIASRGEVQDSAWYYCGNLDARVVGVRWIKSMPGAPSLTRSL